MIADVYIVNQKQQSDYIQLNHYAAVSASKQAVVLGLYDRLPIGLMHYIYHSATNSIITIYNSINQTNVEPISGS